MRNRILLTIITLAGLVLVGSLNAAAEVRPPVIDWQMVGTDVVRFHLGFHNPDSVATMPIDGEMCSQQFGAFLPCWGTIGVFHVPEIMPDSFFDVFFEVPLSTLPPSAGLPPMVKGAQEGPPCPPPIWVGNVDVNWWGPGGQGQVNRHYGTVGVCPGGPPSCLHVITMCAGNITWGFRPLCAGWTASLVNEDLSPAPPLLPPNWTGFVCISANASVPVGNTCCLSLNLWCGGVATSIDICAEACQCPIPTIEKTWGRMKSMYR